MSGDLAGISFPFRVEGGRVRAARGFEKAQEDVRHLLATRLGERAMLRGYGGGVHRYLQDPEDATLRALVGHEIDAALRTYVPDARLVAPIAVESRAGALLVTVEYVADHRAAARRFQVALPAGRRA
jgi:phage baseplate assembly protein W